MTLTIAGRLSDQWGAAITRPCGRTRPTRTRRTARPGRSNCHPSIPRQPAGRDPARLGTHRRHRHSRNIWSVTTTACGRSPAPNSTSWSTSNHLLQRRVRGVHRLHRRRTRRPGAHPHPGSIGLHPVNHPRRPTARRRLGAATSCGTTRRRRCWNEPTCTSVAGRGMTRMRSPPTLRSSSATPASPPERAMDP